MRHYALSRLLKGNAFEGVSTTSRGCRYGFFACRHKISSLVWGCCFVPLIGLNGANISILFYMFQIIWQNIRVI